jgi:hypothetical protein
MKRPSASALLMFLLSRGNFSFATTKRRPALVFIRPAQGGAVLRVLFIVLLKFMPVLGRRTGINFSRTAKNSYRASGKLTG